MNLSKELAKEAKKKGICEEWYFPLKNETNIDKLLEMYVKGIDFCLSNDYPSNHFIEKNFKGKMEKHGIHLDETFELKNEKIVIALGKCNGGIDVTGFNVSQIFIKNDSEISILAKDNSFVMIDLFDNTRLNVYAYNNSKVVINRYGGKISENISENAQIKIIEKHKKTY